MGWRMDSTAGAAIWDTEPLSPADMACRDEELTWLKRYQGSRRNWTLINGRIARSGDPTMMARGNYTAPAAYSNAAALTAVAMTGTTNILWWNPSSYTPIPANSVQAPMALRLHACGLVTTSTTSLTTTMNPSIGTTAQTGGSTPGLGASNAMSFPAATAVTAAFWWLYYSITIRTGGEAGTAVGDGNLVWTTAAGPSASTGQSIFGAGNTVASAINWVTTAQGLSIAAAPSASTITVTPTQVHFATWD